MHDTKGNAMTQGPQEPPSLITLQISDLQQIIESRDGSQLTLIDTSVMEKEGYAIRSRLGPPHPKAPWYPAGKPVTSKEFKMVSRLLSDISQVTLVPTDQFSQLAELHSKQDYHEILEQVRDLINLLLIQFLEHQFTAKMRIFEDMKALVQDTWKDMEQLMFRTAELSEMFKTNLRDLRLSFDELLPTYRETADVKLVMAIETSYQANFAMRMGTCLIACLLIYNEMLKARGAKDPRLRFDKEYRKRNPSETYYLSDKFIENMAFTAYIMNIGLYHSTMDPVLQQLLSETPPTPDQHREIRKATYQKTLEIINAHTILDLPVGKNVLKVLISEEQQEEHDAAAGGLVEPIVLEMLKVCMDYFSLTSQRPYRMKYHRSQVIEYICARLGDEYNIEAANVLFSFFHPFAPGEVLTLNDRKSHQPLYLVKVLGYSKVTRQPQARSMPVVKVIQAAGGAPSLGAGGGPVNLMDLLFGDTRFEAGELVFMGSEEKGAMFLARVEDPAAFKVKFLRCVTRSIPKAKADAIVGKLLEVKPGNPQQRLWKCHAALYLADTVPTQKGDIFE